MSPYINMLYCDQRVLTIVPRKTEEVGGARRKSGALQGNFQHKEFRPIFRLANFNMAFWRLDRNALCWFLVVLAWVQPTRILRVLQISDRRLCLRIPYWLSIIILISISPGDIVATDSDRFTQNPFGQNLHVIMTRSPPKQANCCILLLNTSTFTLLRRNGDEPISTCIIIPINFPHPVMNKCTQVHSV